MEGRRVVITGSGCVTSLGADRAAIAASLDAGRTAFAPAGEGTLFPRQAVCPVNDPGDDVSLRRFRGWRHRRYLSRGASFAALAALRAAQDAGFGEKMPPESHLICAAGPNLDIGADFPPEAETLDHPALEALWLLRWLPNTAATATARFLGIHGECLVVGTACAASLHALGCAWRHVRSGLADTALMIAGDSRLSGGGLLGYAKAGALSRDEDAPRAIRPFDAYRAGFVPGEGGAAFVLETLESAKRRGAPVLGEILGFGASLDAGALTAPDAQATWAQVAVEKALASAGLSPADIAWVSAHGTGTALNDAGESLLLERVFADRGARPLIGALKSWIGHGSAAAGALELAILLAARASGVFPAIRNLSDPLSARLDFALAPRPFPDGAGMLENFGFGGQNGALVVRLGPVA